MKSNAQLWIDHTIAVEGSRFTNHPDDRGKATKYGITQRFVDSIGLEGWDVETLSLTQAEDIYFVQFWTKLKADQLPAVVAWCYLDAAVNHGQNMAGELVQKGLGMNHLEIDGIVGSKTRRHARYTASYGEIMKFWKRYRAERIDFYFDIAAGDSSQRAFLEGWANRLFLLGEGMIESGMVGTK